MSDNQIVLKNKSMYREFWVNQLPYEQYVMFAEVLKNVHLIDCVIFNCNKP